MSYEQYTTLGETTLANAYTVGDGFLDATSVATFPTTGTFSVKVENTIYRIDSIVSSTHLVIGAVEFGSDANHDTATAVKETITARMLDQIRADQHRIGVYSSLPSSGSRRTGDVYHGSDSIYQPVFDGSVWQHFGPTVLCTPPPLVASFTAVNTPSGCTANNNGGALHMYHPPATGDNVYLLSVTKSGSKLTVGMFYTIIRKSGYGHLGIGLRESSSGKCKGICFAVVPDDFGAMYLISRKFNSPTAPSYSDYLTHQGQAFPNAIFFQVEVDSTNMILRLSSDLGLNFMYFDQRSKTDFCTGDEWCIWLDSPGGSSYSGSTLTAFHWKEE